MIKRILYIGTIVLLFFFGLSRFLGLGEGRLEQLLSVLVYPVLKVQKRITHAMRGRDRVLSQASAQGLLQDLEQSLEQRDTLQKELIELKAYLRYAENTKEIRAFLSRYKTDAAKIAQVLVRNFDGQQFYILDAGSKQGVLLDMITVHKESLVGRVIEVYPSYSKILLITDPLCKVAAICAQTGTKGIHEGMGNPNRTALGYVDPLQPIKEGDLVLSSGEGMLFPSGYALGTIKHAENDGHSYTISVEPSAPIKTIDYCCLLPRGVEMMPPTEEPISQEPAIPPVPVSLPLPTTK